MRLALAILRSQNVLCECTNTSADHLTTPDNGCEEDPTKPVCKVDDTDDAPNTCVQCISDDDCANDDNECTSEVTCNLATNECVVLDPVVDGESM